MLIQISGMGVWPYKLVPRYCFNAIEASADSLVRWLMYAMQRSALSRSSIYRQIHIVYIGLLHL